MRGRLADALLLVPQLESVDVLKRIIRHLPFRTDIDEARNASQLALSIVEACWSQPRGWGALADAARLALDTPLGEPFFSVLHREVPLPFLWSELETLKDHLFRVMVPLSKEEAHRTWKIALPEAGAPSFSPEDDDPRTICVDLLAAKSPPALFMFLELIRATFAGVATEVAQWEESMAKKYGHDLAKIRAEAHRRRVAAQAPLPAAAAQPEAVLLICVRPDLDHTDERYYLVEGWLYPAGDRVVLEGRPEFADGVPVSEVANGLPLLVESAMLMQDARAEMRIEVILPLDLFAEPVDQWLFKSGLDELPLGQYFPVVLRSWERLGDKAFGHPQKLMLAKWDRLVTELGEDTRRFWGCLRQLSGAKLRAALDQEETLAFLAVQLTETAGAFKSVLAPVIGSGVPIAFWMRGHQGDADATRRHFTAALPGKPEDWPRWVYLIRKQKPPPCTCDGFVLLWDNPQLRPPFQTGSRRLEPCI
jgi:hypothetical protein